jgi:hypothetical protein
LRGAVLWRKGCFGNQSENGSRFTARILTTVTTLRQQERNIVEYIVEAIQAHRTGQLAPSLLPMVPLYQGKYIFLEIMTTLVISQGQALGGLKCVGTKYSHTTCLKGFRPRNCAPFGSMNAQYIPKSSDPQPSEIAACLSRAII